MTDFFHSLTLLIISLCSPTLHHPPSTLPPLIFQSSQRFRVIFLLIPKQSRQSPPSLLLLRALSPRSWGSGHTWCSWSLQRFAWQRWWCRSPLPTAQCSRGRKRRPSRKWHTGNIECWEGEREGNGKKKDEFRFREKPDQISDTFRNGLKCWIYFLTSRRRCRSPGGYGRNTALPVALSLWGPGARNRRRGRCQRNTAAWPPGSSMAPHPNSAYSSHSNLWETWRSRHIITRVPE